MQNSDFEASEKILLYYPTIDIPSPGWIRQGLMYWDKIGSIVPNSYDEHLPRHLRYSEQIQPIYDAELFRPFNPEDLFNKGWKEKSFESFEKELLKTLKSKDFLQKLPELEQRKFDTPVYAEKVNHILYEKLKKLNLVGEQRDDMIYFEENTSLVYMAVLAKYLADIDNQFTVPSTDLSDYERLNFKADPDIDKSNPCLRVEFRNLLRVPANSVDIKRVIDFRLRRSAELLNFRQQVLDKFEDEIKKCDERKEIKAKTVGFKLKIEKGIQDLDLLLRGAKFQTVTGTMKAIFKPQHITTALTAATATGVSTGSAATAAICGIAGLAGGAAVEIFDFFVSRKNTRLQNLSTNAYSYLYLAEKEFGKARRPTKTN